MSLGHGCGYSQNSPCSPSGTVACTSSGGPPVCYPVGGKAQVLSGPNGPFGPGSQASGTTLPTGPFKGWQYWQASIAMQLAICLVALALSALTLPPVRRLRWLRRGKPVPEST